MVYVSPQQAYELDSQMTPLLVGIAGGSGSGKTTVAHAVQTQIGDRACIIEHDSYYKDRGDLSIDDRGLLNFDHPDSLESSLLVKHLGALRQNIAVDVPIYDFRTHRRSSQVRHLKPAPIIIVEGILVFADAALREMLDVRIYVDTDADIRAFRRIRRDIEQRGRSFESIREQYYRTVRPMHLLFVEPSKRYADVILPEGGDNRIGVELCVGLIDRKSRPAVAQEHDTPIPKDLIEEKET